MRAIDRRIPRYQALSDRGVRERRTRRWPGRRRRHRRAPSTSSSTTSHAAAAAATAGDRSGRGQRPRPLPARAEPRAAPVDGRALVALAASGWSTGRRPHRAVQPMTAPALAAQRLGGASVLAHRAATLRRLPVSVPARRHLRLAPLEEPAPLQRLDPLTRGSLFHEIQTAFFRRWRRTTCCR